MYTDPQKDAGMDWKLIVGLSGFGLLMGVGTVFLIPASTEPLCWLAIFLVCAYLIARLRPQKRFLHGLLVGLLNSVWITAAHVLLFDPYLARHPQEGVMMQSMPLPDQPRLMMILMGPGFGLVSGLILGLLAQVMGRLMRRSRRVARVTW